MRGTFLALYLRFLVAVARWNPLDPPTPPKGAPPASKSRQKTPYESHLTKDRPAQYPDLAPGQVIVTRSYKPPAGRPPHRLPCDNKPGCVIILPPLPEHPYEPAEPTLVGPR